LSEALVEVKDVRKYFKLEAGVFKKRETLRAVDGVSFNIYSGEALGLVGESGSGKTTLGLTMLRLYEPTTGQIFFEGKDICKLKKKEMRHLRRNMQLIFQDPFSSLDPRMTVLDIISEPLAIHNVLERSERFKRVSEVMKDVGLNPKDIYRYPHEFSGGQKQRISIARAISMSPKFVIADEPVSSLDISIRAQILNLLKDIQQKLNLTVLYISHDLSTVKHFCDRICVMYLGKLVEVSPVEEFFNNPQHPYSKALILAIPIPDPRHQREKIFLAGEIPSPTNPPSGCAFHPRCVYCQEQCKKEEPKLVKTGTSEEHLVACYLKS
jgi:peptide/nickel transport system ATP-binding protein/oligopeptide transport system ATP-binding protein